MASYWSVERDGDSVFATIPEPLRYASDTRPEWMTHCASAIRDELRLLEIREGTLLEATLTGEPPHGADLENVLLYNVGVPQAHVHAGVRLRRLAAGGAGVVQHYRRVPIAEADREHEEAGPVLITMRVPVTDSHELETAKSVWLAARRVAVGVAPGASLAPPAIDLRIRVSTGSARSRGSIELVKKLLDGACAALHVYAGPNLEEVTRRLGNELGEDPGTLRDLLSSERGALLGPLDFLWLRGEGLQVSPADDRICAAEVSFAQGPELQLEIELRALPAA